MTFETQITSNLFAEVAQRLPEKAAAAVAEAASRVEAQAKAACPVDSGELQRSIEVLPGDSPLQKLVVAGTDHAAFAEYGTGARGAASSFPGKPEGIPYKSGWPGCRAQPFFTPAAEAERPRFQAAVAAALSESA